MPAEGVRKPVTRLCLHSTLEMQLFKDKSYKADSLNRSQRRDSFIPNFQRFMITGYARMKDAWGGYLYCLCSEALYPRLSIKDAHSFVISTYIRWIKVYRCAQISLHHKSSGIQGTICPHSQITEDSEAHMTRPTPSWGNVLPCQEGKVIYGRITEAPWCMGLDSAWPKFRTHLQFLCLPNLQASGKEQKAQRGNLSKNIYSLFRDCLQETADPLKEGLNLRIQLRITVPVTGWGANHTKTLSGR